MSQAACLHVKVCSWKTQNKQNICLYRSQCKKPQQNILENVMKTPRYYGGNFYKDSSEDRQLDISFQVPSKTVAVSYRTSGKCVMNINEAKDQKIPAACQLSWDPPGMHMARFKQGHIHLTFALFQDIIIVLYILISLG